MVYRSRDAFHWRQKTLQQTLTLRDSILTTSALLQDADLHIWYDIFTLYVLCAFSGLHDKARDLLQAFFDAVPDFEPNPKLPDKRILASIWKHAEATKPANVPWSDGAAFDTTEYDIDDPAFYRFMRWPQFLWTPSTGVIEDTSRLDVHSWKTSQDHWEHGICARLLCRVPEGQVPDRAAITEAFDALDRLFALPRSGVGEPWVFSQVFPLPVYFALAAGLDKLGPGKATEIFEAFIWEGVLVDLMPVPALYEAFLGVNRRESLIDESKAIAAVDTITAALSRRRVKGPQEPLHGLGWPDVLRRFSEAAFKVHADEYAELARPPARPSDILLPPITTEKLAETEQRLGPLPPDMKEMVQVANGFRGAWHLFGGGFPGVDTLEVGPCGEDYLYFMGDMDLDPSEDAKAAPTWTGYGVEENDDYFFYICPPASWRLLAGDRSGADGEYRVSHAAHWSDGGDGNWRSMRDWIASETVAMERQLELEGSGQQEDRGDGELEESD
jgi:hypothetical protein